MKQRAKFSQKQEQIVAQGSQHTVKEFTSPDEMLRSDAARVVIPPDIAERLQKPSGRVHGQPMQRWWYKLFGGA